MCAVVPFPASVLHKGGTAWSLYLAEPVIELAAQHAAPSAAAALLGEHCSSVVQELEAQQEARTHLIMLMMVVQGIWF